jgi:hypothetical protein
MQTQQLFQLPAGDVVMHHIPGLHRKNSASPNEIDGVFLVRVDRAFYRWHPTQPYFCCDSLSLNLKKTAAVH